MALGSTGCQSPPPPQPPKPDLQAEAVKIGQTDAAWMKAYQARDAARHASFYTKDASWMVAGFPKAQGQDEIRKLAESLFKKETGASWRTTRLVASESADLAYQEGTWESTARDAAGKHVRTTGKFITVWQKQPDGNWKVLADSASPDGPPVPVK